MARPFYEEGNYVALVTDQALGKASTGTKQFVLKFKVLGTVDVDNPEEYMPAQNQYERSMYRSLTDKTIKYVSEDLERLGFSGSSFGQLSLDHPQPQSFVGNQINVYCEHKPHYQTGEPQERWGLARSVEANPIQGERLENKELRELDSLFGAYLPGSKAGAAGVGGSAKTAAIKTNGSSQQTAIRPSATKPRDEFDEHMGITNDDVPF